VNVLAQIVPGLRETRTPFAVGLLWAAALWISYQTLPKQGRPTAVDPLVQQAQSLPEGARVSLAVLAIYVLGLVMHFLSDLVYAVLQLATAAILVATVAHYREQLHSLAPYLLVLLIVLALIGVLANYWERFALAQGFELRFRRQGERRAREVEELLIREVEFETEKEPDFYRQLVEHLTYQQLLRAWVLLTGTTVSVVEATVRSLVTLKLDEPAEEPTSGAPDGGDANAIDAERIDTALRGPLLERLQSRPREQVRIVREFADMRDLERRVSQFRNLAEIRLEAKEPLVFADYDRQRAEAEFRDGVAIGLLALEAALLGRVWVATPTFLPFPWQWALAGVLAWIGPVSLRRSASLAAASASALLLSSMLDLIQLERPRGSGYLKLP
jgi:hypothetical protein